MDTDITIRQAQPDDAALLAALLQSLDLSKVRADDPDLVERTAQHLARNLADASHSIYVGDAGEAICGFAAVHWLPYLILPSPEGFVSELFVGPQARGAGLGTRLLDAVVSEARARGCYRLQLMNMRTRDSYQRQFYAKHGWKERADCADFVYSLV